MSAIHQCPDRFYGTQQCELASGHTGAHRVTTPTFYTWPNVNDPEARAKLAAIGAALDEVRMVPSDAIDRLLRHLDTGISGYEELSGRGDVLGALRARSLDSMRAWRAVAALVRAAREAGSAADRQDIPAVGAAKSHVEPGT